MNIHASGEDYLEAILILERRKPIVRSVDLARFLGFTKPSVSHAVQVLCGGGFITVESGGALVLTEVGREVAEKIYARHCFFKEMLEHAGVEAEQAEHDACQIEHVISEETFRKLQAYFADLEKGNRSAV